MKPVFLTMEARGHLPGAPDTDQTFRVQRYVSEPFEAEDVLDMLKSAFPRFQFTDLKITCRPV